MTTSSPTPTRAPWRVSPPGVVTTAAVFAYLEAAWLLAVGVLMLMLDGANWGPTNRADDFRAALVELATIGLGVLHIVGGRRLINGSGRVLLITVALVTAGLHAWLQSGLAVDSPVFVPGLLIAVLAIVFSLLPATSRWVARFR